ncbi:MAG TPA: LytTR family DNA-binding domain-containing protein [Saprospiraceae bacterium]|nr:LytTR family DNA-binding domain-containing protein [Saprospiraceae bacterium]
MFRVYILDDEVSAISLIKHKLTRNFPEDIEIVGSSDNPLEALQQIPELRPDLLFVDVDMPHLTGIEFLEKLEYAEADVVFATAHKEYAIAAIRKSAFDFLVKPIDEDELKECIERLIEKRRSLKKESAELDIETISKLLKGSLSMSEKLKISTSDGILLIPINDIIRIEASGSYSTLFLLDKKKITASKNLSDIEHYLEHYPQFFRLHKSNIVNINFIERYIKGDGGTAVLKDGTEIEVARRRKEEFLERAGIR